MSSSETGNDTPESSGPGDRPPAYVTGIFGSIADFEYGLSELLEAGFDAEQISILGRHEEVANNFGNRVPKAETLQDSPKTPRVSYQLHEGVHQAVHVLSESVAALGMVVMAGVSYAVGGPVGVAAQAGDRTEMEVESFLDQFVDAADHANYRHNLKDGGLICWINCHDADEEKRAADILKAAGGRHVHRVTTEGDEL